METIKQSRFKVVMYRFWIEYKQFFDGESTRRMRRRARMRRIQAEAQTRIGILSGGSLDLYGI